MSTSTKYWIWFYCFLGILLFLGWAVESTSPIVDIESGKIQGSTQTSAKGRTIFAYRGIPYAKPPVEGLRFKPPEPIEMWAGLKNATEEGNMCPQYALTSDDVIGDEDCLFLNVYTPKIPSAGDKNKMPVMVWIHGGLFIFGSGGADLYGPDYLLDEDVVLVTMNYRLGALGFLSTSDQVSPGNYGLKDQLMALKWVKANIGAFGGDAYRITIFGNSAGAASVQYHIMSPLSKGLFHRAISQSGSALNPWAFTSDGVKHARRLAELLGCEDDGQRSSMVNCMRGHTANRIVASTKRMKEWGAEFFNPFVPAAEGRSSLAFLQHDPKKMMKDGKLNKVKYMLGVNSDEGILSSLFLFLHPQLSHDVKYEMYKYLPMYLGYNGEEEKLKEMVAKIHDFYFQNKTLDESQRHKFFEMDMDHKILHGVYTTAKMLSLSSFPKIYFYELSYDGDISLFSFLVKNCPKGVLHADELVYLFKAKLFPKDLKEGSLQAKTSERLIKMWTNFASEGNPTPELTEMLPTLWEPFNSKTKSHLNIGSELKMKTGLYDERMDFWDKIYEKILLKKNRMKDEL